MNFRRTSAGQRERPQLSHVGQFEHQSAGQHSGPLLLTKGKEGERLDVRQNADQRGAMSTVARVLAENDSIEVRVAKGPRREQVI